MNQSQQAGVVPAYVATGRPYTVADVRLNQQLLHEPERCATLSEYSRVTGIDLGRVMDLFAPGLDQGVVAFESVGPEIFVLTAPHGRPLTPGVPDVQPNLWERLRGHGDKHAAFQLWQLVRGMQAAGWVVTANAARTMFALSPVSPVPPLGLELQGQVYPVMARPALEELSSPGGRLDQLSRAGALVVAVVVESGALEEAITACRKLWSTGAATGTVVLLLEGPRFNPVQLSAQDASVAARSVSLQAPPATH